MLLGLSLLYDPEKVRIRLCLEHRHDLMARFSGTPRTPE